MPPAARIFAATSKKHGQEFYQGIGWQSLQGCRQESRMLSEKPFMNPFRSEGWPGVSTRDHIVRNDEFMSTSRQRAPCRISLPLFFRDIARRVVIAPDWLRYPKPFFCPDFFAFLLVTVVSTALLTLRPGRRAFRKRILPCQDTVSRCQDAYRPHSGVYGTRS